MKPKEFSPVTIRSTREFCTRVVTIIVMLVASVQLQAQVGGVDLSFDPGTGADDNVWTTAAQANGKVVIGGRFTSVNGIGRNRIARLNPDGSVDTSFNPGTGANNEVLAVRLDANGKVLIGGKFTSVNGTNCNFIARLNVDGSLDTSFNPGTGANNYVWAIAVQADGKVLLGGEFTSIAGNSRNGIARLTTSGASDDTFAPGTAATNGTVYAIAVQSNGRILIGGNFTTYAGTGRTNIARINSNGTIDATFNPGGGTDSDINTIGLQSDGKIIAGGDFSTFDGVTREYMVRLQTNGALDVTFTAEPNLAVYSVAVQPDDKIVIGGDFDSVSATPRRYVARLQSNGSLDTSFDSSTTSDSTVEAVALQADGRIVAGGWFTTMSNVARSRVARLLVTPNGISPILAGARVGANYNVSFSTLTNTAYLLEYNDSLSTRTWIPLGMVFGDGTAKILTDFDPNVPRRFYRLRTLYSEPYMINPRRVGGSFQVTVPAFAWRTFVLEYKNSLNDLTWTPLPGVAGDNTIKTLSDPAATAAARLYRVRAQ